MRFHKLLITVFISSVLLCFVAKQASGQCFTHYTLAPTTTPTGPNSTYCGPVTLTLSGSQSSSVSYQLNIGGVNYGSPQWGNTGPLTFGPIPVSAGGGTCLVYASQNGSQCGSTVVAGTSIYFATVPAGSITASGTGTGVCPNSPITLTVSANTAVSFQWLSSGSPISGATTSSYPVTQGGTYSVQLISGCYTTTVSYPTTFVTTPSVGTMSAITPNTQQYTQANLPATFTATAANAGIYTWTISQPSAGSISGTGSTATMNWVTTFVGEVTITVTATGCGNPAISSLTINVLPTSSTTYTNQVANYINYIKESDVRVSGVTTSAAVEPIAIGQKNVTFEYYNGLGNAEQKVSQMASSNNNDDVVQQYENDQFGREAVKYQPYTEAVQNGGYHPYNIAELEAYYNPSSPAFTNIAATHFPYAEINFENSSLNRVAEQGAPGDVWQLTGKPTAVSPGHTVKLDFTTNDNTVFSSANTLGSKNVVLYTATVNSDQSRTLAGTTASNYVPGTLSVNIMKDENWVSANGVIGTVEEYKDNMGHVLLKRTYNSSTGGTVELSTYYVYDDFGNLCFVIPPLARPDAGNISQAMLDNLCYQYRYDQKNRLVQKKLPGKGWEFMVYNNIDELVMTQDAKRRDVTPQQWIVTKHDALGRVAYTALYQYAGTTADATYSTPNLQWLQSLESTFQTTADPMWDSRNNTTTMGYDYQSYPQGTTGYTFYTVDYYDGYAAPTGKIPAAFTSATASKMTRGLLTATFTDVLGTSSMLTSVSFYDAYGRVANQFNQHYVGGTLNAGNYDLITNNYNFDNSLSSVQRNHYTSAGGTTPVVTIINTYVYDLIGRQKQLLKSINSATSIILAESVYNEIGQLVTKQLHSTNSGTSFLQNTAYAYNERGWLSSINNPASVSATQSFGEQLYYGNNPNTALNTYNGNVGTVKWQSLVPTGSGITQQEQEYDYTYDNLNRLLKAHYTCPVTANAGAYDEVVAYDVNGNIQTLNRWGLPSGVQQIDQLTYTYASSGLSNQLSSVNDAITAYTQGQPSGLASYGYDLNGDIATDSKKATTVTYNYLNLPQSITQTGNSSTLSFVYAADGRKLRKIYGTTSTRDYDDGIEYNNGAIELIRTEEGRATPGTNYVYEYYLKDHLGNTRLTEKSTGVLYQLQDYYAFGMDIQPSTATTPDNRYKYNGKEWEDEMLLNEYDYGARYYDPIIGRWTSIDPKAEKDRRSSPYAYVFNNPMRFIDPDGMYGDIYNLNGTHVGNDGVNDDKVYVQKNKDDTKLTKEQSAAAEKSGAVQKLDIGEKDFEHFAANVYNETPGLGKKESDKVASAMINRALSHGQSISVMLNNLMFNGDSEEKKMSETWRTTDAKGRMPGHPSIPIKNVATNNYREFMNTSVDGRNNVSAFKTAVRSTVNQFTFHIDLVNGDDSWRGDGEHNHYSKGN